MRSSRAQGRRGEQLAERALLREGYVILARNLHFRHSELDLLGLDGKTLCFIEVRLRSSSAFGSAEESVSLRKQRRIVRAAREFLARTRPPRHDAMRFDVIAIDAGTDPPRVRLIRGAFTADGPCG